MQSEAAELFMPEIHKAFSGRFASPHVHNRLIYNDFFDSEIVGIDEKTKAISNKCLTIFGFML